MTLFIDAIGIPEVKLGLISDTKVYHIFHCERNLSEQLLPEINKFLKKQKVKLNQLEKIDVMAGPGHFSRIRTAVATANSLAYGLGLTQKIVQPIYSKAPNITKSKKGP